MASDWPIIALKDITESINTGLDAIRRAPIVSYKTAIKCLRIQDVSNNKIYRDWGFTDVRPVDYEKYRLRRGEIIMARTCSTGINYLVRVDMEAVFNNGLARIRLKSSTAFPEFVYYVFMSQDFINYIDGISGGTSVQLNMKVGDLAKFQFPLPPLAEQKAIASILGALDDKIELNRRMNATLEGMARALFQSWFVDFDPVRAKLDGRKPEGLDKATAALFPDAFEESEAGQIPKGWMACTLSDIAKNVSITFDFKRVSEVVFINTGDVLEGDFLHSNRSPHAGLPGQAKKSIRPEDILFSEIRPANKRYAYVDFDSSDYVVSTKFMIIRGSQEIHPRLLYRILTAKDTLDEFQVQAESRSGTFPQITFDSISHLPIVLPSIGIQEAFQRAVDKMDDQIKVNKQQSRTLATLRDTLLPKLLSGELSVASTKVKA